MTQQVKIDKNIPIPKERISYKKVLETMEIGDSIVVSNESRSITTYTSKKTGRKFVARRESPKTWRVWRTA